jgi:hypothetical protein
MVLSGPNMLSNHAPLGEKRDQSQRADDEDFKKSGVSVHRDHAAESSLHGVFAKPDRSHRRQERGENRPRGDEARF